MSEFSRVLCPIVFLLCAVTGSAQVSVLTANYGNERTNANLQETRLTPTNISQLNFGKIGNFPVDGQIYSQPLYLSGLSISGGTHDVLLVSTLHDSVYAFDAAAVGSPAPLWRVSLGPSVPSAALGIRDIVPEIGILSTGVVDPQSGTLYVVA